MKLDLPTPVSHPPSLEWCLSTAWHTHHLRGKVPLSGGYAAWCVGTIQGNESGIQVLAGLAPSSQTVGSLFRVIHEQAKHSSWATEAKITFVTWQQSFLSLSLKPTSWKCHFALSFGQMSLLANVVLWKCHLTKRASTFSTKNYNQELIL
jgi:hypothetical protein